MKRVFPRQPPLLSPPASALKHTSCAEKGTAMLPLVAMQARSEAADVVENAQQQLKTEINNTSENSRTTNYMPITLPNENNWNSYPQLDWSRMSPMTFSQKGHCLMESNSVGSA